MQCPVSLYQEPLMVKRTRRALSIAEIVSVGKYLYRPEEVVLSRQKTANGFDLGEDLLHGHI